MKIKEIKFDIRLKAGDICLMQPPIPREIESSIKLSKGERMSLKEKKKQLEKEMNATTPFVIIDMHSELLDGPNKLKDFNIGDYVYINDALVIQHGMGIVLIRDAEIPHLNPVIANAGVLIAVATDVEKWETKYQEIIDSYDKQPEEIEEPKDLQDALEKHAEKNIDLNNLN